MSKRIQESNISILEEELKRPYINKVMADHAKAPKSKDFFIHCVSDRLLSDLGEIFSEMGYKVFQCLEHNHIIVGQKGRTN